MLLTDFNAVEIANIVRLGFRKFPEEIELMLFNGWTSELGTARQNDKRPAYMKVSVPDEWVKNFRGDDKLQDLYIAIRVPAERVAEYAEKKRSETDRGVLLGDKEHSASGATPDIPLPEMQAEVLLDPVPGVTPE